MQVAGALAERMEQRLQRPVVGAPIPGAMADSSMQQKEQAPAKRHGPKPKVIDLGDKDAVRRRVRALQKKIREIEKLRLIPDCALDSLQREKLSSEEEVRNHFKAPRSYRHRPSRKRVTSCPRGFTNITSWVDGPANHGCVHAFVLYPLTVAAEARFHAQKADKGKPLS